MKKVDEKLECQNWFKAIERCRKMLVKIVDEHVGEKRSIWNTWKILMKTDEKSEWKHLDRMFN